MATENTPKRRGRPPKVKAPETPTATPDVLDVEQARALLGVSRPVLRHAMLYQGLPFRKIGPRMYRFSRPALMAWLEGSNASAGPVDLDDLE